MESLLELVNANVTVSVCVGTAVGDLIALAVPGGQCGLAAGPFPTVSLIMYESLATTRVLRIHCPWMLQNPVPEQFGDWEGKLGASRSSLARCDVRPPWQRRHCSVSCRVFFLIIPSFL